MKIAVEVEERVRDCAPDLFDKIQNNELSLLDATVEYVKQVRQS